MKVEEARHYLYTLKTLGDTRGGLIVVNAEAEIPFKMQRAFYNYNTEINTIRGNHANINSSFVMISVAGVCSVDVDDGKHITEYVLDSPEKALFVGKGLWKVMKNFSKDNVLLIFSDCLYDELEYIRDYEEYIKLVNKRR